MTLPELKEILEALNLPIAYYQWMPGEVPSLPYIVYYIDEDIGFMADDIVYHEGKAVTIEVYSDKKDLKLEQETKDLLNKNGIAYKTYESFLEQEDMFLKAYEIII